MWVTTPLGWTYERSIAARGGLAHIAISGPFQLETVEEFGNRDEPAPERDQVSHGCNESGVEGAAVPETIGEMRVHDADAAVFSESIDVSSCQKSSEIANVPPFRAREPAAHVGPIGWRTNRNERPIGIKARQRYWEAEEINLTKYQSFWTLGYLACAPA